MESYAGSAYGKSVEDGTKRLADSPTRGKCISNLPRKSMSKSPLKEVSILFEVTLIDRPQRPTQHVEEGNCSESLRDSRAHLPRSPLPSELVS
jgi:hypothetical protein